MIVVFGASTDIGRRLAARLQAAGLAHRKVSRSMGAEAVVADLATGGGVAEAIAGARVVVSCAHARHTAEILKACPSDVQIVLVGSAWRYSCVENARADEVRAAEALFLASPHRGVMLHPSMIYGGNQENNIRRLLRTIRRLPVIPAPGTGSQIVCPIYVDDLVDCLFAAVTREWEGRSAFGVAGPALTWKRMVELSAGSIGLRRRFLPTPLQPTIVVLDFLKKIGIQVLDPNVVRRFGEDVDISTENMLKWLSVKPRRFESGIAAAVDNWRREGSL